MEKKENVWCGEDTEKRKGIIISFPKRKLFATRWRARRKRRNKSWRRKKGMGREGVGNEMNMLMTREGLWQRLILK